MVLTKLNAKHQRAFIIATVIMASVYTYAYLFLLNFFPPPAPTLAPDKVVALYATENLKFRLGVVLMIATGAFYTPFSIVLAIQMARDEQGVPIWAITQALASVIGTWLFAFPPVMWGIAAFSVDRMPEITVFMHEAAWLTFVTPASIFPFQAIPVVAVALSRKVDESKSAFPRWLGFLTMWFTVTGTIGSIAQAFKTGPFAWNGLFTFYIPFVVFGVWFSATLFTVLRALKRQEEAAAT